MTYGIDHPAVMAGAKILVARDGLSFISSSNIKTLSVVAEILNGAHVITSANPAPAWHDVPGGTEDAVTITPGPYHTTRRIAELNDVVSALTKSNNNLVDNQGIHDAAIAELQRRVEAVEKGYDALNDRLIIYEMGPGEGEEYEEGEPGWDDAPPQPTPPAAPDEDALWEQVYQAASKAMPYGPRAVADDVMATATELGLVSSRKNGGA